MADIKDFFTNIKDFFWGGYKDIPKGLTSTFLIIFGVTFFGQPAGVISALSNPELYGMQFIVLFVCVLLSGSFLSILLYLFLFFLNILFQGIYFIDIFRGGISIEKLLENLMSFFPLFTSMWLHHLITAAYIYIFGIIAKWLRSKMNKDIYFVSVSNIMAIFVGTVGLTILNTFRINIDIGSFFQGFLPFVILIQTLCIFGVYYLINEKKLGGLVIVVILSIIVYFILLKVNAPVIEPEIEQELELISKIL